MKQGIGKRSDVKDRARKTLKTHVYFLSEAIRELGMEKKKKMDLIGFTELKTKKGTM